jgi:ParB-like chromosome segregation protein Spo0J
MRADAQKIMKSLGGIETRDVPIDSIEMGERFRCDLGDCAELAQSIIDDGLIHPIAVTENGDEKYVVVAGGRRLTAIRMIKEKTGVKTVSVRIMPKLSELELRLAELSENVYRKQLTWKEDCDLKAAIVDLQQQIHGKKISTAKDAPGVSQTDVARSIGVSKPVLSADVKLSRLMQDTPGIDWTKFKNKSEAMNAIKHAVKAGKTARKVEEVKRELSSTQNIKTKIIDSYHVNDFFKGIQKVGDNTMDFVELDPPYAIDLEGQKKNYNYNGYNEVDASDYPDFLKRVFSECYRVMKRDAAMVVWFAPNPWFQPIADLLSETGFKVKTLPCIWVKGVDEKGEGFVESATGQVTNPEYDLAKGYEMFFVARKGAPRIYKQGRANVFGFRPVAHQEKIHPTERPQSLITEILTTFTSPGSNVLVPFAGSGNTLIAAYKLDMIALGFDLTQSYKDGYTVRVYKEF